MKVNCPCCGAAVYSRANACVACGFRPRGEEFRGFLRALSTVSSILVGFCLTGLVDLTGVHPETPLQSWAWLGCAASWLIAAVLFLLTLFGSELLLHRGRLSSGFQLPEEARGALDRQCSWLIALFLFALLGLGIGLIALSAYFSPLYAILATVLVIGGIAFLIRLLTSGPDAGQQ
jgi:hypothetical protein